MTLKEEFLSGKNIVGPNRLGFDLEKLNRYYEFSNKSHEDTRIVNAAIFFNIYLSNLREQESIKELNLERNLLIQSFIAGAAANILHLSNIENEAFQKKLQTDGGYSMSDLQKKTIKGIDGSQNSIDEYIAGTGDALTSIFKHIQSKKFDDCKLTSTDINQELLNKLKKEINIATMYNIAVDHWQECLRNGYEISEFLHSLKISSTDIQQDKNRAISLYRRTHISHIEAKDYGDLWNHKFDTKTKIVEHEIKLVSDVTITDKVISKIDLSFNKENLNNSALVFSALQEKLIESGPLASIFYKELPEIKGVNIKLLCCSLRFLISLTHIILKSTNKDSQPSNTLELCPKIPKVILLEALQQSLSINNEIADRLIDTLIFSKSKKSRELWFQPLIEVDSNNLLLAIPCTFSPRFDKTVEEWLEIGGLNPEIKGKPFESHVIKTLELISKKSPISQNVKIYDKEFKLSSIDRNVGPIDVLISIGKIVLIIECKYIKWPEGAVAHYDYQNRIIKGAEQLKKQIQTIKSNKNKFRQLAAKENFNIPENFKTIPLVMVNTPTSVGLKIGKSYVIDLSILITFLTNEYIKAEIGYGDKPTQRYTLKIYDDIKSAEEKILSYLDNPPQLSDMKEALKLRSFDYVCIGNKKVEFVTYDVDIDTDATMEKYGISKNSSTTKFTTQLIE
ncbi:MAG: hypothetical protein ACRBEE_15685 [Arenicella sp.]